MMKRHIEIHIGKEVFKFACKPPARNPPEPTPSTGPSTTPLRIERPIKDRQKQAYRAMKRQQPRSIGIRAESLSDVLLKLSRQLTHAQRRALAEAIMRGVADESASRTTLLELDIAALE